MAKEKALLVQKTCNMAQIILWCQENGKIEWLKATCLNRPAFFTIKKAFFTAFMPEAMPKKKEKQTTIFDLIEAL